MARRGRSWLRAGDLRECMGLAQHPCQHLQVVGYTRIDAESRRWFESAMHHAVLASRVVAFAVGLPRRLRHKRFESLVVAVRDQIARAFPTLHVVSRIAPGC